MSIDDVSGGYLAARHLIDIGRRRLAFVGGPLSVRQVADRLQGTSRAVRETGGSATLEIIDVEPRVISVGHEVGAELAGRPEENRPDGVFAVNDMLGIGLVQTLVTSGVSVPDDIAVIGYDDIEYAENSLVPLASIRPPHHEFGIAAVDLMLFTVEDGDPPADLHRVFAPELVVRRSAEA